jgi:hypothetical protein
MQRYINLSDRHTVTVGGDPPIEPGASGVLAYSAALQDLLDRHILQLDQSTVEPTTVAQLKRWLDDRGVVYARGARLAELREVYLRSAKGESDGGNG